MNIRKWWQNRRRRRTKVERRSRANSRVLPKSSKPQRGRPNAYYVHGKRVSSVSTIVNSMTDLNAMMGWQRKMFLNNLPAIIELFDRGESFAELLDDEAKFARNVGSGVHSLIEYELFGKVDKEPEFNSQEELEHAEIGLHNFRLWWDEGQTIAVDRERPMVHPVHGYAGTFDLIGIRNGKRILVDYKSSKAIYGSHLAQVALYCMLVEEGLLYEPRVKTEDLKPLDFGPIEEVVLLRVDKDLEGVLAPRYVTGDTLAQCKDAARNAILPFFHAKKFFDKAAK